MSASQAYKEPITLMHHSTTSTTQPPVQLQLPGNLTVRFDLDPVTSDAGLPLIAQIDQKIGLTKRLAPLFPDDRNPLFITHSVHDILRQRVYGIIAGYEDANDAAHLRGDPAFKLACGRTISDPKDDLASQPTISRFEARVNNRSLYRMYVALFEDWLNRRKPPKSRLILDFDSTWDPTHGAQQLSFFNGHYDSYGYHPLLVHDVETGEQIFAMLRPGSVGAAAGMLGILKRMVARIRERWPKCRILVRGDAGFAFPELYDWCEDNGVDYLIGLSINKVLERLSADNLKVARISYYGWLVKKGGVGRGYTEFKYRAKVWRQERRVIAKAEFGALGPNQRYVITNLKGRLPRQMYAFYCQRGQMENGIKDFKNALFADRLSCSSFKMNALRLVLHAIAHRLCRAVASELKGTVAAVWQFDTLRLKLLKVAGHVVQQARKTLIRLPRRYPYKELWIHLADQIGPPATAIV
jgi:hypothetical protein